MTSHMAVIHHAVAAHGSRPREPRGREVGRSRSERSSRSGSEEPFDQGVGEHSLANGLPFSTPFDSRDMQEVVRRNCTLQSLAGMLHKHSCHGAACFPRKTVNHRWFLLEPASGTIKYWRPGRREGPPRRTWDLKKLCSMERNDAQRCLALDFLGAKRVLQLSWISEAEYGMWMALLAQYDVSAGLGSARAAPTTAETAYIPVGSRLLPPRMPTQDDPFPTSPSSCGPFCLADPSEVDAVEARGLRPAVSAPTRPQTHSEVDGSCGTTIGRSRRNSKSSDISLRLSRRS